MSCKCTGIGWPKPDGCRRNGECLCSDECCNTGWHAYDGGGITDFMPEKDNCTCTPSGELT